MNLGQLRQHGESQIVGIREAGHRAGCGEETSPALQVELLGQKSIFGNEQKNWGFEGTGYLQVSNKGITVRGRRVNASGRWIAAIWGLAIFVVFQARIVARNTGDATSFRYVLLGSLAVAALLTGALSRKSRTEEKSLTIPVRELHGVRVGRWGEKAHLKFKAYGAWHSAASMFDVKLPIRLEELGGLLRLHGIDFKGEAVNDAETG